MNRSLIADRYAKAVFKLAIEQSELEKAAKDMALLHSFCKEGGTFTELLASPVIKPRHKKDMLHSVLEGHISTISLNFLDLLLTNNREMLLEDIVRRFISLHKEQQGIKAVVLYSAIDLEESYHSQIKKYLEDQFKVPIELTIKTKPELIGGFILTVDGKMADASISSKLKYIKKELLS